jgi:hypothetical protein
VCRHHRRFIVRMKMAGSFCPVVFFTITKSLDLLRSAVCTFCITIRFSLEVLTESLWQEFTPKERLLMAKCYSSCINCGMLLTVAEPNWPSTATSYGPARVNKRICGAFIAGAVPKIAGACLPKPSTISSSLARLICQQSTS